MDRLLSLSLVDGQLPAVVWAIVAVALALALGWRTRRWRLIGIPAASVVAIVAMIAMHVLIDLDGVADNPVPTYLSVAVALSGLALGVLIFGWTTARWWRRAISLFAVCVCLFAAALGLNRWTGYFATVDSAWEQVTAGPFPNQTDEEDLVAKAEDTQKWHELPAKGSVVPVTIPSSASGFEHREEFVYLPPAWFATTPPPQLPVVMMIGGQHNTPEDWLRAGHAVSTIEQFAAAHEGNAPVFIFADPSGGVTIDTECVNGSRGNAADHLTKDIVPFMTEKFGVSPNPKNWGIVGYSMGGTCAVDLVTMHPELFRSFVDIAGDKSPNSGTKEGTIKRLFGGNADAWATFDPSTVMAKHGPYTGVSGWFAVAESLPPDTGPAEAKTEEAKQRDAAENLCALGKQNDIDCAVVTAYGMHDWRFAPKVFVDALPWLAGAIGTPSVPQIPLPGSEPLPTPPADPTAGAKPSG